MDALLKEATIELIKSRGNDLADELEADGTVGLGAAIHAAGVLAGKFSNDEQSLIQGVAIITDLFAKVAAETYKARHTH